MHQLGATILPVLSVGVQGDTRTYRHPALLWPTKGALPDWRSLIAAASGIINRLSTVNRAIFTPEDCAGRLFTLREQYCNQPALDRLRQVDAVVREQIADLHQVWQCPVVSLPIEDEQGRQVFVVRPITSSDAMTADVFHMPQERLDALQQAVRAVPGVGLLVYDLTTKPPGTIEWE